MNKAGRKGGGNRWKLTPWERLLSQVDQNGPMTDGGTRCWLWLGSTASNGYGHMWLNGKQRRAHRAAWEILNGPIPDGLEIDHLCRNRACVNVIHMEVVTRRENNRRGNSLSAIRARQTHCKRGHEFTVENTYISKRGERVCRACRAARGRATRRGLDIDAYVHVRSEDVAERFRFLVGDKGA